MSTNPKAGQLRDRRSNPQLVPGELQLECDRGAVSVMDEGGYALLTVVRGVAGRKAQVARLDRDQLITLVGLLRGTVERIDRAAAPKAAP